MSNKCRTWGKDRAIIKGFHSKQSTTEDVMTGPEMYVAYQALDNVNYDTLQSDRDYERLIRFNGEAEESQERGESEKCESPVSLLESAAKTIVCTDEMSQLSDALEFLPQIYLVNLLLRAAIKYDKVLAAMVLISEWPAKELCLMDVYPESREYLFRPSHKFDSTIFLSLMRRVAVKDKCKLSKIDLRSFYLNQEFRSVLINSLPFSTLPEAERHPRQLTQHLLRYLSQQGCTASLLTLDSPLPSIFTDMISAKLEQNPARIYIPPGQRLTIEVDRLEFSGEESDSLINFMMVGGLQAVLPYSIESDSLCVQTHEPSIQRPRTTSDTFGPFLALMGQNPKTLKGLSVSSWDGVVFPYLLKGLERFTSLHALDLGDCSLALSENTGTRFLLRQRFVGLFSQLTRLTRLDISYSDIRGHLSTLLDVLSVPLHYLSVSGCDLEVADLTYLSSCKHSASLKEVHLNGLVHRGNIDSPDPVLNCLEQLCAAGVAVAAIQSNDIEGHRIETLCRILSTSSHLKILDTLYNLLDEDALLELAQRATLCASLKVLSINLRPLVDHQPDEIVARRTQMQQKVEEIMQRNSRCDITVVVVAMGVEEDDSDQD